MAQINGQRQDFGVELWLALSLPAQQAVDGEGVTQIVQPWAGLQGGPTQLIPERTEGGPDLLISQPLSLFIEEEGAAL